MKNKNRAAELHGRKRQPNSISPVSDAIVDQMRPHRKLRSMGSVEAVDGREVMEFRSTFKIAQDTRITGVTFREKRQVKFR